jgi:hypothetical protein
VFVGAGGAVGADRPVVAALAQAGSSARAARSAPDRPVVAALAQVGSSARAAVAVGSSAPVVVVARAAMAYPLALALVVAYPLAPAPVVAYPLAPAPVVAYPLAPAPAVLVYLLVQDKSVASSVQVVAVVQVMVTPQAVSFLLASALEWRLPAPPQKVVWPLPCYSELQWERLLDEATPATDKGLEIMFLIGSSARLAVAEYTVSTRLSLPLLLLSLSIE